MILITGANGMVGSYVKGIFNDEDLYLTDIDTLDVTDYQSVETMVNKVKPDIILHLAAKTDVDKCEMEIDDTYRTNTIGTQNMALICQKKNILLVYISTAGVFGGQKLESYTEFDEPNPANIYGWSKLEGEKIVQNLLNEYFIVRAGWMFGGGSKDKKFISKIIKLSEEKDELNVVSDKIGSPTFAKNLLEGIKRLVATKYYGLYHMTNKGTCSRYEVSLEIMKILGKKTKVNPVSSAYFPLPAPRARSEAMRNYKLDLLGLNTMPTWQEALKEYLTMEWLGRKKDS